MRFITSLFFLLCLAGGISAGGRTEVQRELTDDDIHTLKGTLTSFPADTGNGGHFQDFLDYYAKDSFSGTVSYGWFTSGERRLMAYLFTPETEPVATVLLLHGYLDHSLSNIKMIRFLLDSGYQVAAFDLPGHGLSDGPDAHINNFREYSYALKRFLQRMESQSIVPDYALAHSTGCSVIMEYLNYYENPFRKIIFAAPLVRAVASRWTPLGLTLAEPFSDEVGRRFGHSSSNEEHEYFVEHLDPLQSPTVPYSWVYASIEWRERMEDSSVRDDIQVHILQGKEDQVVDYKSNIPFLLKTYPGSSISWFPEGEHSLFNEIPSIRNNVFERTLQLLEEEG